MISLIGRACLGRASEDHQGEGGDGGTKTWLRHDLGSVVIARSGDDRVDEFGLDVAVAEVNRERRTSSKSIANDGRRLVFSAALRRAQTWMP
ncbi:hypothetical protein, partial [Sorangium cellulosum]|uniref:hypothetical protein n=1 Tax=Sorangium cellulosum TaxID=56 RepID=UPI001F208B11